MSDKVIKTIFPDRVQYTLEAKFHRVDGPAIEYASGSKQWYLHGKLHRDNGPAVEFADGEKHWYFNGQYHREDGPAIEYVSGIKEYWVDGECLDFITNDQMLIYYLKYGFLK